MPTITTRIGTYYDEPDKMQIIEKHDDNGKLISHLYASLTTGQIMQVETVEDYQGEGHAHSLITYAVENDIELYHSPSWSCTEDGKAFAEACDEINTIDDEDAYGWDEYQSTFAA